MTRGSAMTGPPPAPRAAAPADPDLTPCDVCRETGIAPDDPAANCEFCIRGYRPTDHEEVSV